ncbi:ABC transporter ATP-binding protein [Zophobihabitans entericus]|uniref:ATP-binding cassette domain-containing protein n=1 Tax=Zophobihabitans entericus TaxID=1635327 RepID=A0A6G9IBU7_9GAMM|nr:ABC transporter ATP-binding protein [Zophobihabitans entericus]QIQ21708.1 ATP-binding cassette domain-containing protein [Zophobihabitans entericus]
MTQGLSVKQLTFYYHPESDEPILEDFNIEIPQGSVVLFTGASGCGKSTLCHILAGIYPKHSGHISHGEVLFNGQDIQNLPAAERAKTVGLMFQNPNLQFCMNTVENELIFCLENIQTPRADIQPKVDETLSFCHIESLRHRELYTLSGGEKQQVMLACMIALGSQYIILDEPFANIDPATSKKLCDRLAAYQQEHQATLIIVDHHISNFINIADEMIVLGPKGKILYRHIDRNNLSQYSDKLTEAGVALPKQAYRPTLFEPSEPIKHAPIFTLKNVGIRYEDRQILNDINLDFYRGKMTALTGKSGSGKSSLLSALSRMLNYQGTIFLQDKPIKKISAKSYAIKVGIVFQNPLDQFITNSVYDEIAFSLPEIAHQAEIPTLVQYYLQQVNLWQYRDFSPYMLSQGQQRRLAVCALMACQCEILLCDEPTYGLDRRSAQNMMNFLLRQVKERHISIIFTTHDLELAKSYGQYWYHCEEGTIINCYTGSEESQCNI